MLDTARCARLALSWRPLQSKVMVKELWSPPIARLQEITPSSAMSLGSITPANSWEADGGVTSCRKEVVKPRPAGPRYAARELTHEHDPGAAEKGEQQSTPIRF